MKAIKTLYCEPEIFAKFTSTAKKEGMYVGNFLELLLENFLSKKEKINGQSENNQTVGDNARNG